MTPLISIIIPVYNSENYITDTVASCINQSYTNLEIILVNDGSTDKSEEKILQFNDKRIRYFKIANQGACEARNFGISKAKGQLYQFLDHDDLIDEKKLQHQIETFLDHGEDYVYSGTMGTVSGTAKKIDAGYELYEQNFSPQQYYETKLNQFGKHITTGAWLVPAKMVDSTNGWDSKAGLNDDGEYFMRVILNSTGIIYCRKSIFYFRRDVPNSLSKQFSSKEVYIKWLYSYQSFVKHFLQKFENNIARELGWKALSVYYCDSYPHYPELLLQCKMHIRDLGYKQPFPQGGPLFNKIAKLISTDAALWLWEWKKRIVKH